MKIKKIVTILLCIFIVGCSNKAISETQKIEKVTEITTEVNSNLEKQQKDKNIPLKDGEINLSMRIPKTLNPIINQDATVDNVLKLIFEPLFTLDDNLKPIPNLASSYSISNDGKTLTINMKDSIYWQDGKPITSKDVIFSLDTIKTNPNSIYFPSLNKISSYSSNGNQVIIQYIEPYFWGVYNLCFPIIPKHYYEKNLQLDSNANFKPIGSGNFKFSSYRMANYLILERHTNFKGTPNINKINIFFTPDKKTDLNSFETNITNVIKLDFNDWVKLNFNRTKIDNKFDTNKYEFLGFNHNIPIFKNINFRKAIAYAIPKDEIIQNIFLESAIKTNSPINPNAWNSNFQEIENYDYNIQKAIENLALTNLNLKEVKTTILVNSENEQRIEIANLITKKLKQIGINVSIILKPFDKYIESLKNGDFQMYLGGIDFNIVPNFESFLSSFGLGEGGLNYFKYSNQNMDNLILNISKSIGEENFLKACKEFEQFFSKDLPIIGICFKKDILLTDYTIQGNKNPGLLNQYKNIFDWYKVAEEVEND